MNQLAPVSDWDVLERIARYCGVNRLRAVATAKARRGARRQSGANLPQNSDREIEHTTIGLHFLQRYSARFSGAIKLITADPIRRRSAMHAKNFLAFSRALLNDSPTERLAWQCHAFRGNLCVGLVAAIAGSRALKEGIGAQNQKFPLQSVPTVVRSHRGIQDQFSCNTLSETGAVPMENRFLENMFLILSAFLFYRTVLFWRIQR
jgi:hypothetical protein